MTSTNGGGYRMFPWRRALRMVRRLPGIVRASLLFAGAKKSGRVHSAGPLSVRGAAGISVGDEVFFLDGPLRTELVCRPGAELTVGAGTGFNYGVSLQASRSIRIGVECAFGAMVRIRDDDGQRVAPVLIGDRVWIAHGAIIEPGVTIGDDAVISAGSVVMSDVPARMIALGNPARLLPLGLHRAPKVPGAAAV
jgi:acetyltransferase-like isoleucine patch superfamily enzyme